jgi:hypothetical protein
MSYVGFDGLNHIQSEFIREVNVILLLLYKFLWDNLIINKLIISNIEI